MTQTDPTRSIEPPAPADSPPQALESPGPNATPPFFLVSIKKLLVLSIFTLGVYEIYWFYKNWQLVRDHERTRIHPFLRAFFAQFFCYALFRRMRDYPLDADGEQGRRLPAGLLAIGWIVSILASRLPDPYWILSFLSPVFLVPPQLVAQRIASHVAPAAPRNDRFTTINLLTVGFCGALLALAVAGVLFPDESDPRSDLRCPEWRGHERDISQELRISQCSEVIQWGNASGSALARIHFVRGLAYFFKDEHDRAIRDFDRAIELQPDRAPPYRYRGKSYLVKRQHDLAISSFDRALAVQPDDIDTLLDRAVTYLEKGDDDKAIQDYNRAIGPGLSRHDAYVQRGYAFLRKNDHDRAARDLARAMVLKPDDFAPYFYLAEVHRAKKQWDRALLAYGEALRLNPEDPGAYLARDGRAQVYLEVGSYDRAIEEFDAVVRQKPGLARALNNRCWARAVANVALDQAMADCNESLRINPKSSYTLNSRAFVSLRLGALDKAIADTDAALAVDPKSAHSLYVRGLAKSRKGGSREGRSDMDRAMEIDPEIATRFARYGVIP